jgi:hypothetical protein
MTRPELYLPDGTPVDGPRTTAAEYSETGSALHRAFLALGWTPAEYVDLRAAIEHTDQDYRAALDYEAERYAEALTGARAMRSREFHRLTCPANDGTIGHPIVAAAFSWERAHGLPAWTDQAGAWLR